MELELLKKRFETPKLNKYLEQLDEITEKEFWDSIVAIKEIFPNADIYHAGSSKFGYLGIGIKPSSDVRVKEFTLVCSLNENCDEDGHYYIQYWIIEKLYTYIKNQDDQLPQFFEPITHQIQDFKDWLKQIKKHATEFNFELNGQALLPSDYKEDFNFTTEEAYQYLTKRYQVIEIEKENKKIVGFRNTKGGECALNLEVKNPSIFIGIDPENNNQFSFSFLKKQNGDITKSLEHEGRHSGLETNAPSLYIGHNAFYITLNTLQDLEKFCDWYEQSDDQTTTFEKKIRQTTELMEEVMIQQPLNRILFGAAGTGKTFHSINHALSIIENKPLNVLENEDRTELKKRFDQYKEQGQIKFVTFHQSFSYEDFVEGIRAETDDAGQLTYDVKVGVFKEICEDAQSEIAAKQNNDQVPTDASINSAMDKLITKAKVEEIIFHTKRGAEIKVSSNSAGTLFAFTSTGTNITLSIRHIRNYLKAQTDIIVDQKSYEWAIAKSLRSEIEYTSSIEKVKPYVLIIDEINRGNISRIFGELITLIEDSKRQGAEEALSVTLPYSKEEFSVPNNVFIVGTMNSSDRSLTGLDIALRRRFTFVEMPPKPELLNDVVIEGLNVGNLLEVINQRIEVLLDRDHCIGHANFMSLKKQPTLEHLASIFKQKIIPQLQEYFFDDWSKINLVFFNNEMLIEDKTLNISSLFPSNFEQELGYSNEKKIWKINEDAFKTIDAFIQILGSKE